MTDVPVVNIKVDLLTLLCAVQDCCLGEYSRTGGFLKINKDNELLDGYHRLVECMVLGVKELRCEVGNGDTNPAREEFIAKPNDRFCGLERYYDASVLEDVCCALGGGV
ncbi:MAG: hypothetical protein WC444_04390 [Candidatus Paceibacterota bacterium]